MKSEDHWISVSDLMAGLMMVFLFISISLLIKERSKVKDIQEKVNETKTLYEKMKCVLMKEFKKDFTQWGVALLADGTIRFESPKIMFSSGSHKLKPRFKNILKSFCPRYVKQLQHNFDSEKIHEIRIIGHASSDWNTRRHKTKAFKNIILSTRRALSVHEFCYESLKREDRQWLSKKTITISAGFVHPIKNNSGKEDKIRSKRVEFKVEFKPFSELREKLFKVQDQRKEFCEQ